MTLPPNAGEAPVPETINRDPFLDTETQVDVSWAFIDANLEKLRGVATTSAQIMALIDHWNDLSIANIHLTAERLKSSGGKFRALDERLKKTDKDLKQSLVDLKLPAEIVSSLNGVGLLLKSAVSLVGKV